MTWLNWNPELTKTEMLHEHLLKHNENDHIQGWLQDNSNITPPVFSDSFRRDIVDIPHH